MPSSTHVHISKMVDWIVRLQPKSVLDIGVGFGKWGFLAREYTDINAHHYKREDWRVRIEGVEAFPEYSTPTYHYIYDKVHYGDLRIVLPELPEFDLVIVGDVIEHFDKEVGLELLQQLRRKSRHILLSSPTVFFTQELFDNEFERHRSLWTVDDFAGFRFDYDEFDQWVFVALLEGDLKGKNSVQLDGKTSRLVYKRPMLKRHPKIAHLAKSVLSRVL